VTGEGCDLFIAAICEGDDTYCCAELRPPRWCPALPPHPPSVAGGIVISAKVGHLDLTPDFDPRAESLMTKGQQRRLECVSGTSALSPETGYFERFLIGSVATVGSE